MNTPLRPAPIPAAAIITSERRSIDSVRMRLRSDGAAQFAPRIERFPSPTAKANHAVPAISVRNQKARWKNMNPTAARRNRIVFAACSTRWEWSSSYSRSWFSAGVPCVRGRCHACHAAERNTSAPA
ncbi:MAG: hypothetical protein RI891_805 [Gemmatimonadota bacterium]